MGNLGGGEILVILLVALIVLGPEKLPGAARQVGNVFRQFRAMSLDFRAEFEDALNAADEPVAQSPEELAAESAARARGAELIAAENAAKADNPAASPENGQQIDQTDDPKDPTADHGGTSSIGVSEPFAAVTPAPPASKPASLAYRPDAGKVPDTVCGGCGHLSPKGARFCINCGAALGAAATTAEEAPSDPDLDLDEAPTAPSPEAPPEPIDPDEAGRDR